MTKNNFIPALFIFLFFQLSFTSCFDGKPPGKTTGVIIPADTVFITRDIQLSGKIQNLAEESHAWIVVEEKDSLNNSWYWPKAEIKKIDEHGNWKLKVYEDGPGKIFSISLFAVQEKGQAIIQNWFDEGMKTSSFPAMDSIPTGERLYLVEGLELLINENE